MRRRTNEDPPRIATTPLALRDDELSAVSGAAYEAYLAIKGTKQGAYDGQRLIGVGTCTK